MDYQEYVRYEPFLARRAWAATLDYLLYAALLWGYVYFFGEQTAEGTIGVKGFKHVFALMVIWFLYFPVMEGTLGFTLFKGLFDLKIAQDRRNDFQFAVAFKRHLLDPIDFFLFGVVAIILVKTREDHKRLGDILAHSRVVLDKDEEQSGGQTSSGGKESSG